MIHALFYLIIPGYVVTTRTIDQPLATFTVKHELKTWLAKHIWATTFNVWRCRDNPSHTEELPVLMTEDEL